MITLPNGTSLNLYSLKRMVDFVDELVAPTDEQAAEELSLALNSKKEMPLREEGTQAPEGC